MLSSLFHHTGDEKSLQSFHSLVEKCKRNDFREGSFSDENTNQNSAYSTDTESSDDSQFVSLPRSANIVLTPPSNIIKTSSSSSGSFQLNPWGSCKIASKPRLPLTVSPAAIKLKHLAYLFSESLPSKTEKTQKSDLMDSPPVTRKRPKSGTTQCAYSTSTLPGQQNCSIAPADTRSTTTTTSSSNLPFGRPAWYNGGGDASTSEVAPTSSCESARKLLKCSSLPSQSGPDQSAISASLVKPILPRTPPIHETAKRFTTAGEMIQSSVALCPEHKANFTSKIER